VEKGKRRWFEVPMGVLPWNMSWAKGNDKLGHPSLRFYLNLFNKIVFQQRYRDVVGHAISTREKN
jgi:hypothetical protein